MSMWTEINRAGKMTRRETEVANLIAEGLTNPAIANRLCVSRRTISTHVTHILTKLNLSSRTQIAVWITRHDLTESRRPDVS